MKNKYLVISILTFAFVLFIAGVSLGFEIGSKKQKKIVHVDFSDNEKYLGENDYKYQFLSREDSLYIERLCAELKIDSDLAVAILLVENPKFDSQAQHTNENGTIDVGMFQLNSKYIYTDFVPKYWDFDIEFNPMNKKHNIFLALHHIEYLCSSLKIQEDVICAYNCGIGKVLSGEIPEKTRNYYLKSVMNNLILLKGVQSG